MSTTTTLPRMLFALLLAALSGAALPQPAPAASAASVPGRGMGPGGMGAGPGMMGHGMMRWGKDATPGWSMMSPQERSEHQQKMQAMKTRDECTAYHAQLREQMAARAKERGVTMPAPRRDPCAGLPN